MFSEKTILNISQKKNTSDGELKRKVSNNGLQEKEQQLKMTVFKVNYRSIFGTLSNVYSRAFLLPRTCLTGSSYICA